MTVQEYNNDFLPKVDQASLIANGLEKIIRHAEIGRVGYEEVMRTLKVYGWSEEVQKTLNDALELYRTEKGIKQLKNE